MGYLERHTPVVRDYARSLEQGQEEGVREAAARARANMMTLNRHGGTDFAELDEDGAFVEFMPDPPLRVLLNLMGTLFTDLEALWWVYRRGAQWPAKRKRTVRCCGCGE